MKFQVFIIRYWATDNSDIENLKDEFLVSKFEKFDEYRRGRMENTVSLLFHRFSRTCCEYGSVFLWPLPFLRARARYRREGKERRKERRDGDVPREMEGTDAPGTVISPGEENGERDPWHVERSKKGERKLDICSMPWYAAQLILGNTDVPGKNYQTVCNCNEAQLYIL